MKTPLPDVQAWITWALAQGEPIDPDKLFALRAKIEGGEVELTHTERDYLATCAALLRMVLDHAEQQAAALAMLRALQSGEVRATVIGVERAADKPERKH